MPNFTYISAHTVISRHAAIRMQQRAIPAAAVDLLLDFARPTSVGGGALSYRFTDDTWDAAMSAIGDAGPALRRFRNAYVIEGRNGVVVTAAWIH